MPKQHTLEYICTPQVVREDDGHLRKAYRFHVLETGGKEPKLVCAVNDVCAHEEEARELEGLFRRNQISPAHILDVLEDWIAYRTRR